MKQIVYTKAMRRRTWWQKPIIKTDEEENKQRKVTWLELFFDLFFVVVIAQLSHNLANEMSLGGVAHFVILFIAAWWIWIGHTFYEERFATEGIEARLFTFSLMIPTAGLAIFAHHGLGDNYPGFALSYLLARLIITILWIRGGIHNKEYRPIAFRFGLGSSISMVLVLISITFEPSVSILLFSLALLIDLVTPTTASRHYEKVPKLSTSRLPERFGLFTIIVLGEILVSVILGIANKHHFTIELASIGILGLLVIFQLWWVYFDFIARRPFKLNPISTQFWVYLHMLLSMGYVLVGVGFLRLISSDTPLISTEYAHFIIYAAAFSLVTLGLLEMTLRRESDEPTHPTLSPLLKIITGFIVIAIAMTLKDIPTIPLLGIIITSLLIQMAYGVYVWFTQRIE